QQRRRQEFLIVRRFVLCSIEYLQAVIQNVALRVILKTLLHVFERKQQGFVNLKPIHLLADLRQLRIEIEIRIFASHKLFELGNAGPLDSFARNGAFEDVVTLVGGIDRQLEWKFAPQMNVIESIRFASFADLLPFDFVDQAFLVEYVSDSFNRIGK